MDNKLKAVALEFRFQGNIESIEPLGEGLINDTYLVKTSDTTPDYILQRKNKNIFRNIPAMMDNICKVTTHLKRKVAEAGGNPQREVLTVIPQIDGHYYFADSDGEYWAACLYIQDTVTYQQADTPELAEKGGAAIGRFQSQLADLRENLADTLPGFHNMRFRFEQWDDTLRRDPVGRASQVREEIGWIQSRRDRMMEFWAKVESGEIPRRVTHNDTKISNVLFEQDGRALCVIDLDTILMSCGLNDYGDAIRSYANHGLEDDENLDNVYLDWDIFAGFTRGYLSEANSFLKPVEKENLAFSALFITFEQVLRFLMDYIDGDNYYKVKNERHNLVRTHAQYKLLQSLEENLPRMNEFVYSIK